MATIQVTIPDDKVARVSEAFQAVFDYGGTKKPSETVIQFVARQMRYFARDITVGHEDQNLGTARSDAYTALAQADKTALDAFKTDLGMDD